MTTSRDLAQIIETAPDLEWLDRAACAPLDVGHLDMFFVSAGKSLSPEARDLCASCPSRRACLIHAYEREIAGGYFAAVSPAKRRSMTLDEALESIGEAPSC